MDRSKSLSGEPSAPTTVRARLQAFAERYGAVANLNVLIAIVGGRGLGG